MGETKRCQKTDCPIDVEKGGWCSSCDRHICTPSNPWSEEKGKRSAHPYSNFVSTNSDYSAGGTDYDNYNCPCCGERFTVEIAQ